MINIGKILTTATQALKKYKYALLILFLGMALLLLPDGKEQDQPVMIDDQTSPFSVDDYVRDMEQRLSHVLSQISGVGETQVVLTLRQSEQIHYLYDTQLRRDTGDTGSTTEETQKTVIISSGSAYDEAMVTRKDYPLFQGALIVCRGGGEAEVKLKLTQAVSALTDLSSDKITILEMK